MVKVPPHLQDVTGNLSENGFAVTGTWYHGTSSALLASIQQEGLKRSGDKALRQAAKKTMATIGNSFKETLEPVFLTQSKTLAYYWATQTVLRRRARFEGQEEPRVLAVRLPAAQQEKVRPDVGAAAMLMIAGDAFIEFLSGLYEGQGLPVPALDSGNLDRLDYLNRLGMAYIDADVEPHCLDVLLP